MKMECENIICCDDGEIDVMKAIRFNHYGCFKKGMKSQIISFVVVKEILNLIEFKMMKSNFKYKICIFKYMVCFCPDFLYMIIQHFKYGELKYLWSRCEKWKMKDCVKEAFVGLKIYKMRGDKIKRLDIYLKNCSFIGEV
jgi:hypothetical protein